MQTFLPYGDFVRSARSLDTDRLGVQRIECRQILSVLFGGCGVLTPNNFFISYAESPSWQHHPVTRMWKDYEHCLCLYGIAICEEWLRRGHVDRMRAFFVKLSKNLTNTGGPPWLGDESFHLSHRSHLFSKYPDWYGPMFAPEIVPTGLPYVWPKTRYCVQGENS